MSINDLTLAQLRAIASLMGEQPASKAAAAPATAPHPFAGQYVICRCYSAGVHAGTLVSQTGDQAVLENSRRLWSWKAKDGIALSGLSQHGLESGKVDTMVPTIALTGVIETIPCSKTAKESIHGAATKR